VGGRAALLVPFARAADDHQRTNAKALEDAGAARMIEEKDLTGETLAREITALVDEPSRIGAMEEAARRLGRPDAAARVAELVLGDAPAGVATC
jgi:UDP-N-acetylglucosamine--N-acetylmuramyl-(pentapeptide) pyrophosphoryl-undecaprenol N-acetylglucosamine transferase